MIELSSEAYLWIKALHIISVMAWMAGMLYLPRLFVYHCEAEKGSELSETLKIMERRLFYAIITPAMISALIFGSLLFFNLESDTWTDGWVIAKGLFVFGLFGMYDMMRKWQGNFAADANIKSQKFYRIMNEVPTVLMIGAVIFVVVKPF
ncbi:MAG: protoporphyrinogen oxidase HemJ [Rhodospirillaceae bacterium]|jgi:protoporphyrinogen IX oxidase|nr:protoporphyrinogen oxidase HemJ [Rhodospirillaceae bacterium]MBT5938388.1 protoporphyrinogen oxidase HemJ [Rhodospirillaceae bacterium]